MHNMGVKWTFFVEDSEKLNDFLSQVRIRSHDETFKSLIF